MDRERLRACDLSARQRRALASILTNAVRMHGETWKHGSRLDELEIVKLYGTKRGTRVAVAGYIRHKGVKPGNLLHALGSSHFHFFIGPQGSVCIAGKKKAERWYRIAISVAYGKGDGS